MLPQEIQCQLLCAILDPSQVEVSVQKHFFVFQGTQGSSLVVGLPFSTYLLKYLLFRSFLSNKVLLKAFAI